MIRPGKGSRTGATEAREESETSGACAGLGDWAAAIVRAHRHGLAQLGVLVTHLDQSGGFGALEHRRPGDRQLRRDGKLQQPCSQIAEQFFRRGGYTCVTSPKCGSRGCGARVRRITRPAGAGPDAHVY